VLSYFIFYLVSFSPDDPNGETDLGDFIVFKLLKVCWIIEI